MCGVKLSVACDQNLSHPARRSSLDLYSILPAAADIRILSSGAA